MMKWFYSMIAIVVLFQMFHLPSSASLPLKVSTEFITAHRGSSSDAPENTITAIRQAIKDKAGIVEIDVRMTADGEVILSHDDSLKRTAGLPIFISQSSYAELRDINVANKFTYQYGKVRIPTLVEALELARGHILVNVELKSPSDQPLLAEKVVRIIESLNMAEDCVITSFDREALNQVHELSETIQTGIIIGSVKHLNHDLYSDKHIDALSLRASLIDREVMKQAREHKLLVYAWTVNDKDLMREMIRYKVDSIITDKPALLYRLLNY
jgi:glycerophosphoryl diester phosphodiesterase